MTVFETDDLIVREFTEDDFSRWHEVLSDPEAMRFYPAPFTAEKIREWIEWTKGCYAEHGFGLWALILKETGEFIGDCGITMQNIWEDGRLFPEVGYHVIRRFQGRGYASRAAAGCVRYAFDVLGMPEIFSKQRADHEASRRVAVNAGMTLREEFTGKNGIRKSVYSVKRDEAGGSKA